MMRRRIYLLRHADVSYFGPDGAPVPPADVRLTAAGREQAEAAGRAVAGVALDRVVTSTLPRTIETASIVAPAYEPERWPELDEWRGGRLRDLPDDGAERAFVSALRVDDENARFLGGESLGAVLDRVLPAFDRLLALEWDTLLAVLHGGVNRILLSHALTGGRSYFGGFEQAPACINVVDVGADDAVVRTVNYIPYDPLHPARSTTMEQLWEQYLPYRAARAGRRAE
jgi:probable phosphoglycerate mutase